MIKKLFIFLALALPLLAGAQTAVGGWKSYSPFDGVERMAETDTYVYYVSCATLYRLDKDTQEVECLGVNTQADVALVEETIQKLS